MVRIEFFDPDFQQSGIKITYSVIVAGYKGRWIFVRHHKKNTYEIPAGHIEEHESPFDAAWRELEEETGATDFSLKCISTYSVEEHGNVGFGRLFYAEVTEIGPIVDHAEIAEIIFLEKLPDKLTYPEIQSKLFERVINFVGRGID